MRSRLLFGKCPSLDSRFCDWDQVYDKRGRRRPVRRLRPEILKEFKRLTGNRIVWEKDNRAWRKRKLHRRIGRVAAVPQMVLSCELAVDPYCPEKSRRWLYFSLSLSLTSLTCSLSKETPMRKLGLISSLCVALTFAVTIVSSSRAQISNDIIKIGVMADMMVRCPPREDVVR